MPLVMTLIAGLLVLGVVVYVGATIGLVVLTPFVLTGTAPVIAGKESAHLLTAVPPLVLAAAGVSVIVAGALVYRAQRLRIRRAWAVQSVATTKPFIVGFALHVLLTFVVAFGFTWVLEAVMPLVGGSGSMAIPGVVGAIALFPFALLMWELSLRARDRKAAAPVAASGLRRSATRPATASMTRLRRKHPAMAWSIEVAVVGAACLGVFLALRTFLLDVALALSATSSDPGLKVPDLAPTQITIGLSCLVAVFFSSVMLRVSVRTYGSHIRSQYVLALATATVGTLIVCIALVMTSPWVDVPVSIYLAVLALTIAGVLVLRGWQRSWRGKGYSPSPLAGIMNPQPRAGQVWFFDHVDAYDERKVRPAILLDRRANEVLLCALTTGDFARAHSEQNIVIPEAWTQLRGMSPRMVAGKADNTQYVNKQSRWVPRGDLTFYVAPGPNWLYVQLCRLNGVVLSPNAHTFPRARGRRRRPLRWFAKPSRELAVAQEGTQHG